MRILDEIPQDLLFRDTPRTRGLQEGDGTRDCHLGKYLWLLTSLEEVAQEGTDFTKGEDKLAPRRVESSSEKRTPYSGNIR